MYDVQSKRVRVLCQHPALAKFRAERAKDAQLVRSISLAPDEALATLAAGNARYLNGLQGARPPGKDLRAAPARDRQNPIATIIGCADSQVPIEILLMHDPRISSVPRNAGNTCTHAEGSHVGGVSVILARAWW